MNKLDYDPTYPRNPKTLGEYSRKYRKDKGLTIGEIAQKLGIHELPPIRWENGKRLPHPKYLEGLRRVIPALVAVAKNSYGIIGRCQNRSGFCLSEPIRVGLCFISLLRKFF